MERRPRLCFLSTGGPNPNPGFGFHLRGERTRGGQWIRRVEPGSCAELSGLRAGDRVVEVNGENVERETHHQVSRYSRREAQEREGQVTGRDNQLRLVGRLFSNPRGP